MTQKQKIGYKILKRSTRNSIVVSVGKYQPGRHYPQGKRVIPKEFCGPLCVFDSFKHAKNWTYSGIVKKCKYTPSKHTYVWDVQGKGYWCLPYGTILADSVTCLE